MKIILNIVLFILLILFAQYRSSKNMNVENIIYSSDSINQYVGDKGFFIDKRDGKKYKWVKIGEQIWMAENLKYRTNNGCIPPIGKDKKAIKLGYLYDGNTAQIVCPKGWHLPSKSEFESLSSFLGQDMREVFSVLTKGNDTIFNHLHTGVYYKNEDYFKYNKLIRRFRLDEYWTSSICYTDSLSIKYYNTFTINYFREIALVGNLGNHSSDFYCPIRCIKNE